MASQMSSNNEEIFMQHKLQFTNSLKDLKNLKEELYSAAEHFESSYDQNNQKKIVVESSKDYVAKALVSTVDHLGSIADELNKFLDRESNEFSEATIRLSSIEQRLNSFRGFMELRGISQQWLMIDNPKHQKHYIIPGKDKETQLGESKVLYRNCILCPPNDMQKRSNQENSISAAYRAARIKSHSLFSRKGHSRTPSSTESSPNPSNFSFTRLMPNKETGKRSISPFRFPVRRSGAVSPSPSVNKPRSPSEPRRPILSFITKPEMTNRERETELYTRKSSNLFKALLSGHHASGKDIALNKLYENVQLQ